MTKIWGLNGVQGDWPSQKRLYGEVVVISIDYDEADDEDYNTSYHCVRFRVGDGWEKGESWNDPVLDFNESAIYAFDSGAITMLSSSVDSFVRHHRPEIIWTVDPERGIDLMQYKEGQ